MDDPGRSVPWEVVRGLPDGLDKNDSSVEVRSVGGMESIAGGTVVCSGVREGNGRVRKDQ